MKRRASRVSPAEAAALRIVQLPGIRQSAWEAAQALLAQLKAERRAPHQTRLDAITGREGRA